MSDRIDVVAAALTRDLEARLAPILTLGGPDGVVEATRTAARLARLIAPALCSPNPHEVAETVIDVGSALDIGPDTPAGWWAGPVGRICAASLAGVTTDQVTARQAQAMLGLSKPRIYQLLDAGQLERHPDGGVTLQSVYQRLGGA